MEEDQSSSDDLLESEELKAEDIPEYEEDEEVNNMLGSNNFKSIFVLIATV